MLTDLKRNDCAQEKGSGILELIYAVLFLISDSRLIKYIGFEYIVLKDKLTIQLMQSKMYSFLSSHINFPKIPQDDFGPSLSVKVSMACLWFSDRYFCMRRTG